MSQEQKKDIQPEFGASQTVEMKVADVDVEEYKSGIPISGWDNIKEALYAFASGRPRRSTATEDHNVKAYGEVGGGLGAAFFLMGNRRENPSSFVDRMLEEAQPQVKGRGRWNRHYDYDGQGSFHKTSVDIKALDATKGEYLLGLNAAYVGKDVEDGLAEHLGVEQGLQWKSVNVKFQPEGDKFKVDFNNVLRKMRKVRHELQKPQKSILSEVLQFLRGHKMTEGEQLAHHFMATDRFESTPKPVVLGTTEDGLEVTLGFGRVGHRFEYEDGERSESKWAQNGAVIETPLARSYRDESKLEAPSLVISVHRAGPESYDRLPIIDPKAKARADKLAKEIAEAFKK